MPHFIFIQQIPVLNIVNMLYNSIFFSSKCRLFHNATLFGFCITHILNIECAKIWKKKSVAKRLIQWSMRRQTVETLDDGLNDRGIVFRFPKGVAIFFCSVAHSACYSVGTGGSSLRGKRTGREADHILLHLARRLGLRGTMPPLPLPLHIEAFLKHRDSLRFMRWQFCCLAL